MAATRQRAGRIGFWQAPTQLVAGDIFSVLISFIMKVLYDVFDWPAAGDEKKDISHVIVLEKRSFY